MLSNPIYDLKFESSCLMKYLTNHTETKIGLGSQNKSFKAWRVFKLQFGNNSSPMHEARLKSGCENSGCMNGISKDSSPTSWDA